MKTLKPELQERLIIVDITCNKCGDTTKRTHDFEYVTIWGNFGYGSQKDREYHEAHLCEPCYDELIKSFKLAPEIEENGY